MNQYLSLLNPFGRIDSEQKAVVHARGSAVGLAVSALVALWGALKVWLWPGSITKVMQASMAAQPQASDPEAARMVEAMVPAMISMAATMSIIFAVGFAIFAAVQWSKLTRAIPLIFASFSALGLMGLVLGVIMVSAGVTPAPAVPLAETVISRVLAVAVFLLHLGGFRGAAALAKYRDA